MASYLNDEVTDQGLDYADTNGTRIDICSALPTTYAEATSTFSLGNKTGLNTGATQNGASSGRRVIVPAITDGNVTGNGTATHWALTDGSGTLIAAQTLASSQVVTSGNVFTLPAINITIPDPS
jgi:hypothetical protein